ncbi:hypothetical protein M0R45_036892 [Rubus argutus]|uniref:Uncharacterized protein n=1 Tax=Rubus argutus TaxID=59490 RepID=A0AAW1VYB2_RUBAR
MEDVQEQKSLTCNSCELWKEALQDILMFVSSVGQDGEDEIVVEDVASVHREPPQDANGPPKVDSKLETLHDKVQKQIIKEGHGPIPSKYSTCFLHYRAWTESTP